MADIATRRRDKSGSMILWIHDGADVTATTQNMRFRSFQDGRFPNSYVVQTSGVDKSTFIVRDTSVGTNKLIYDAQVSVEDNGDWTEGARMTRTQVDNWELAIINERFIKNGLQDADDATKNDTQRRRLYEGVLMAYGVDRTTAESLSLAAQNHTTKFALYPEFDELGMTKVQKRMRQLMHIPDVADTDNLATVIAGWKTDFPLDLLRSIIASIMARDDKGWGIFDLRIDEDNILRTTIGKAANSPAETNLWETESTANGPRTKKAQVAKVYDNAINLVNRV